MWRCSPLAGPYDEEKTMLELLTLFLRSLSWEWHLDDAPQPTEPDAHGVPRPPDPR
jgi:hypothetical protein